MCIRDRSVNGVGALSKKCFAVLVDESLFLSQEGVVAITPTSNADVYKRQSGGAWSKNEAMVDWIALQFPKILAAFKAARCL